MLFSIHCTILPRLACTLLSVCYFIYVFCTCTYMHAILCLLSPAAISCSLCGPGIQLSGDRDRGSCWEMEKLHWCWGKLHFNCIMCLASFAWQSCKKGYNNYIYSIVDMCRVLCTFGDFESSVGWQWLVTGCAHTYLPSLCLHKARSRERKESAYFKWLVIDHSNIHHPPQHPFAPPSQFGRCSLP